VSNSTHWYSMGDTIGEYLAVPSGEHEEAPHLRRTGRGDDRKRGSDMTTVPNGDEVREAYQSSGDGLDYKRRYFERGDEFDAWIATLRAEVYRDAARLITQVEPAYGNTTAWVYPGNRAAERALVEEAVRLESARDAS
jgi:hypothetical protein